MKEPARIHINRLQDAKRLKDEQKKDILKLTAEDSRLAYRLIKQTLDTMYQQAPAHFRDSLQQRQKHLRYLKEYIP